MEPARVPPARLRRRADQLPLVGRVAGRAADPARVLATARRRSLRRSSRGLRRGARASARRNGGGVTLDSPYKGLIPFEDTDVDALLFFGRERESAIIEENVLAA